MAGGPIGQNTGTSGGFSGGQPYMPYTPQTQGSRPFMDLAAIQRAQTQAASGFTPMGVPQTQTQAPQYVDDLAHLNNFSGLIAGLDDRNYGTGTTARPPMDSTMVDDFGSRNPSIYNPGLDDRNYGTGTTGGLGQTPSPFRSVLPIFTQSGQGNAVFDPSSDPRLALANRQQFNALKRQQRFISDPMQELFKQNFVNRYMSGNLHGRQMQDMQPGMAFQQLPITVGNRTNNNYYQATPFGAANNGIVNLLR